MPEEAQPVGGDGIFATTRWTIVLGAAHTRVPGSQEALAEIFKRYWKPLYGFARAGGMPPDQAQDGIQDFFVYLIENRIIAHADRTRGRFRTFLLACLRNFLHTAHRRASAQKRGGEFHFVPLDAPTLEEAEMQHQSIRWDPEEAFDAQWALAVFERALARLRAEAAERKREHLFDHLQPFLTGGGEMGTETYAAVAERMNVSIPMVKTAISRLRERFRAMLREEVATTVSEPDEVDDEMRHLRRMLALALGHREK